MTDVAPTPETPTPAPSSSPFAPPAPIVLPAPAPAEAATTDPAVAELTAQVSQLTALVASLAKAQSAPASSTPTPASDTPPAALTKDEVPEVGTAISFKGREGVVLEVLEGTRSNGKTSWTQYQCKVGLFREAPLVDAEQLERL